MAKGILQFSTDKCKGCELCIEACPKKVLSLDYTKVNSKGYHTIMEEKPDTCIACGNCAVMCPDSVIEIERSEN